MKRFNTLLLALLAFLMVFPLLIAITNSFMSDSEILNTYLDLEEGGKDKRFISLKLIPDTLSLSQYYQVLIGNNKYLRMFWNTCFIVIPLVILNLIVSSMAAFGFSKLRFRFREQLFFLYIVIMMMPFQVTLVPNYLILNRLGLLESYLAIILPGTFNTFGVFLLKQFMDTIPNEYIEAARMEGLSTIQIFCKIVLPLCKEGIAALFILSFIDNWNMVEQPLIFLRDVNSHPLSLYLSTINPYSLGIAFAAGVIYMIPMMIVFLYGENYLIEGVKHSRIK